jgi:uncharacterized damage-inducible protein DinB
MEPIAEAIIKDIDSCFETISSLTADVSEEALSAPAMPNGWSVKDTVAHIAAWDWRCAALLNESYDTNTPLKAHPDVDALNEEIYQERKHWRWAKVKRDFREANRALIEAIRSLPPERLQDDVIQQSISEETCEHYYQHIPDLKKWREEMVDKQALDQR